TGNVCLYNLHDDLGEQHDLASAQPDRVKTMRATLHAWYRETGAKFLRPRAAGQNEGLASLQANVGDSPSALHTRDDRLYIPMRTALAVVDPTKVLPESSPPPVIIRRVLVNDVPVAALGGVAPASALPDLHLPGAFRLGP